MVLSLDLFHFKNIQVFVNFNLVLFWHGLMLFSMCLLNDKNVFFALFLSCIKAHPAWWQAEGRLAPCLHAILCVSLLHEGISCLLLSLIPASFKLQTRLERSNLPELTLGPLSWLPPFHLHEWALLPWLLLRDLSDLGPCPLRTAINSLLSNLCCCLTNRRLWSICEALNVV